MRVRRRSLRRRIWLGLRCRDPPLIVGGLGEERGSGEERRWSGGPLGSERRGCP